MRRNAGGYSAEECEVLFDRASDCNPTRDGITAQRTKSIKHGEMLDVEIFPVYGKRAAREARRQVKGSTEAQHRLNLRHSQDRIIRLANTNFGPGDMMITCTAFDAEDEKDARRIVTNFILRLKRAFARKGRELKYIYAIEWTESAAHGRRYHLHILVNGHGFDRDWIESFWKVSMCNTRRYQYNEQGFTGLAAYLKIDKPGSRSTHKGKAGRRVWNCSRNLAEPVTTYSDHRISRRKAERIACAFDIEARQILEKAYPEYTVVGEVRARRSEWVSGVYLYARMRRRDTVK